MRRRKKWDPQKTSLSTFLLLPRICPKPTTSTHLLLCPFPRPPSATATSIPCTNSKSDVSTTPPFALPPVTIPHFRSQLSDLLLLHREALTLLEQIIAAHPGLAEFKFLLARLYNELGDTRSTRKAFDDILADNPLSFEALFENSLLMDRCGEGQVVMIRLEQAFRSAEDEGKKKAARDVRLIIAQMEFLRKDVEGALRFIKDDGTGFWPYFCKGMIFSLTGKDDEAKEMFRKYKQLSPRKFDVEGYLRIKVFGAIVTD